MITRIQLCMSSGLSACKTHQPESGFAPARLWCGQRRPPPQRSVDTQMDRLPQLPVYLLPNYACLKITAPPHLPPQKGSHSPHCSIFRSEMDKAFLRGEKKLLGCYQPCPCTGRGSGAASCHERTRAALSGQRGLGFCLCTWGRAPTAWHGTLAALRGLARAQGCCKCQQHRAQRPPSAASPHPAQPAMGGPTES